MTLSPPYVFGTKITGRGHRIKGVPCQDAYASELVIPSQIVIAIADGLGSAPRSNLGAHCAVESAVNAVTSLMAEGLTDSNLLLREGIVNARKALFEKAALEICPVRELACTMLLIIASIDRIAVAHIGDGAVVIKGSGIVRILSEPHNSEYVNVVVPLTSDDWEEALRIYSSIEPIECIAAFTDGLQNAALLKVNNTYKPFEAFFNPLFSYAMKIEDIDAAENDIKDLLISEKVQGSSDDDMTLVISVLNTNIVTENV
jgi:hypothetical protein